MAWKPAKPGCPQSWYRRCLASWAPPAWQSMPPGNRPPRVVGMNTTITTTITITPMATMVTVAPDTVHTPVVSDE